MEYVARYPSLHELLWHTRFVVVVAHRRFGKTTVALNHLLMVAAACPLPRARCAYIAPLRTQAKAIAWNELKHWSARIPQRVVNETELYVDLPQATGDTARVRLFGADNPDALRGQYFDYVVLDEVAQMRLETWEEVVRPTLSDRHGGALFIGTPKGVNLFSQLYAHAAQQEARDDGEWAARRYPVTATKALPDAEIDVLRKDMSENAFRQEYLCDFAASSDDTLITLDEVTAAMARTADMDLCRQWPLVVGVDVGMRQDPTVVFARQGNWAHEPVIWRGLNTVEITHRLLAYIAVHKPAHMCIDVGFNPGVYDTLVELARAHDTVISAIHFGHSANSNVYLNKRVEMWCAVRDWLRHGGRLPANETLRAELTAPTTWRDESNRIHLEPKETLKKRLGHSTDLADALALTFAIPLGPGKADIFPEFNERYGLKAAGNLRDWMTGEERSRAYDPFAGM